MPCLGLKLAQIRPKRLLVWQHALFVYISIHTHRRAHLFIRIHIDNRTIGSVDQVARGEGGGASGCTLRALTHDLLSYFLSIYSIYYPQKASK